MGSRLVLPIPPPDNHAYVSGVSRYKGKQVVRRVRTSATRQFKTEAGWLATNWRAHANWRLPKPGRKVVLSYWVYWPDHRRRDPANLLKVLLDSLEGILYVDDSTVLPRCMDYGVDPECPRLEVELSLPDA